MEAWPSLGKSHTLVAEVNPTNDRPATTNGFRQDKTRVKVNFQLEFVDTTWVLGGCVSRGADLFCRNLQL